VFSTILLFIGGNRPDAPRSYMDVWNLGHVLLFAVGGYLLIRDWKYLARKSFAVQAIVIMVICLIVGTATELIQVNFDRTPDIGDLGRDILGGLIAVLFFTPSRLHISKKQLKLFQTMLVLFLLLAMLPLARSLSDELLAQNQFPLLSDFETPFEIYRWDAYSEISTDNTIARSGNSSLKLKLTTEKYSGVFLKYFPSDWTGYKNLSFSIYIPDVDSLMISCRINDAQHRKKNYHYSDRYNNRYYLSTGWNDISIPLENIKNAPKTRFMDIAKIELFGIFAVRLPNPRIIYIDNVRLY
jgi:hypothetical protein